MDYARKPRPFTFHFIECALCWLQATIAIIITIPTMSPEHNSREEKMYEEFLFIIMKCVWMRNVCTNSTTEKWCMHAFYSLLALKRTNIQLQRMKDNKEPGHTHTHIPTRTSEWTRMEIHLLKPKQRMPVGRYTRFSNTFSYLNTENIGAWFGNAVVVLVD